MSVQNQVDIRIYRNTKSGLSSSWEHAANHTIWLNEKPYAGKYIMESTGYPLMIHSVVEVANSDRFIAYAKVLDPDFLHRDIIAS